MTFEMREALLRLPKAELHVHLRGAIPIQVFAELLNRHSPSDPLRDARRGHRELFQRYDNIRPFLAPRQWPADAVSSLFRYDTFDQFLATFCFTGYFVRDASDFRRLVAGVLASLRAQNVVYAEITVSAIEYVWQGISLAEMKACLEEAAESPGIRVQWIVDLVRDIGPDAALALLKEIVALRCESIVGITLGGSEHGYPPAQFAEVYRTARDHGLRLTVHAGEGLGPESVWDALRVLRAERIGHGVRAVEDPSLVEHLAERRIPLEVCPTSNLRTGIYPSYAAHPARALHEAGVPITINSDDPTFFGTTLVDEYAHVHAAGLGVGDVLEVVKNGFRYAFLPKEDVEGYLGRVEREWERLSQGG